MGRLLLIALMALFLPPCPSSADITHIVKKGDTLSIISRRYGVSVTRLATYNRVKNRNRIRIGQRLKIPSLKSDPAYMAYIPKDLPKVKVSRRWRTIIIHHSATTTGTVKGMDSVHRRRGMENGLAYHFVIGNGKGMKDGEIAIGSRWSKQLNGGHLKSERQNRTSIGICLVGNFDRTRPTRKQLQSLENLVRFLKDRCKLKNEAIKTHRQVNVVGTRCPGKHFPLKTFLRSL